LPIKIIIHGFTNSRANSPWLFDFKDAFMEVEPSNVIIVDWNYGARAPFYSNATANTRMIGKQTCLLVKDILDIYYDSNWKKAHIYCVGHSLGAHVCGYASNDCNTKFDRITAMDAAGPSFEVNHYK
jgi:pancreatic lipase-related protein 1